MFSLLLDVHQVLEAFAEMNYGLINTDHIHWKSLLYTKRRLFWFASFSISNAY